VTVGRAAILGYGRFGAALTGLLAEAGIAVRVLDPHASVPEPLRAASPADLVLGADVVFLAVPIASLVDALAALRPHLRPTQLVLDVCSVKVGPERALASALGGEIPWAATHPLFGPTSLALAERPLRVIVCPNAVHEGAAARARALYERLGCVVLEQDAHAHDRAMAETHAVAFFVAKGVLDAGMGLDVPYAPPSFQAIARTVGAVRSDAGHLFTAIQRENPYAAEARRRLLEAMRDIDATLAHEDAGPDAKQTSEDAARLSIPDLGARSPALREARQLIDEVDRELVALLARRAELARRAGQAKSEIGHGVVDPAREASLVAERRAWGAESGLDAPAVEEVFRAILRLSRRAQRPG